MPRFPRRLAGRAPRQAFALARAQLDVPGERLLGFQHGELAAGDEALPLPIRFAVAAVHGIGALELSALGIALRELPACVVHFPNVDVGVGVEAGLCPLEQLERLGVATACPCNARCSTMTGADP